MLFVEDVSTLHVNLSEHRYISVFFTLFSQKECVVSDKRDEVRPEELMRGLGFNSRDIHPADELADFLREWSDKEEFVADLEFILGNGRRDKARPEDVFEHLADSSNVYTVEEMIEAAEKIGEGEWMRPPDIDSTGRVPETVFRDKVAVPREYEFKPVSQYMASSRFRDEGKEVWLEHHEEGWYQTEIKPLSPDEFTDFFRTLEEKTSSRFLHEVVYGNCAYFLDSNDVEYFFRFRDDIDGFDEEIYRIESDFDDFMMEASMLPGSKEYRAMIFSREGHEYPLQAYGEVASQKLVQGIKSRLRLEEKTF